MPANTASPTRSPSSSSNKAPISNLARASRVGFTSSANMLAERSRAISTSRDWSNTVSSKFPHWGRASAARTKAHPRPSHSPLALRLAAGRSVTARAPAQRRMTLGRLSAPPLPVGPRKTAHAKNGATGTSAKIHGCSQ